MPTRLRTVLDPATQGPIRRPIPVIAAVLACLAGPSGAHPHIFVDPLAGSRFDDDGRLASLRITWTYDAFTSLVTFDQLALDADRDGLLDGADRAAIVAGETEWPPDYNGDVHLDAGGVQVAMGRPHDGEAWLEDDRVSVAFDLPLAAPLDVSDGARLRLCDPYYYYAYAMVGLEGGGPTSCEARIERFEPDAATATIQTQLAALSQEETPTQENVGALFADEVHLSCG
jgi:ABC-type uncharacterized transport system substrate-binding protein